MRLIYHVHTLVMHAKDTDIIGILVATTNTTDEPTVCLTEMENFQTKNAKQPNNFITVSYRHRPALIVFLSFVSSVAPFFRWQTTLSLLFLFVFSTFISIFESIQLEHEIAALLFTIAATTQKAAKSTFIYMCVCHMHCCRVCGRTANTKKEAHKHTYTWQSPSLSSSPRKKKRILLYRFCDVTHVMLDNPS